MVIRGSKQKKGITEILAGIAIIIAYAPAIGLACQFVLGPARLPRLQKGPAVGAEFCPGFVVGHMGFAQIHAVALDVGPTLREKHACATEHPRKSSRG